jgi:hypothetical protein
MNHAIESNVFLLQFCNVIKETIIHNLFNKTWLLAYERKRIQCVFFSVPMWIAYKTLAIFKDLFEFFLKITEFVTNFLKSGSEYTIYNLQIYHQGFLLQFIVICWAKIFYQDHIQMSFVNESHGTIARHIPPWIGIPGWAASIMWIMGFSKAYSITKFWLPIHISNTFMNCQFALKLALQHQK